MEKERKEIRETKRQEASRERPPYRHIRNIKTMKGVAPRRRERTSHPSILADFKAALSQFKSAYEEGDTSNVPFAGVRRTGGLGIDAVSRPSPVKASKPWVFTTKPQFKRLEKSFKEPMVDVFDEATEVQIIIDLGNFKRGEVDIDIKPDKYIIFAKKGDREFKEEIVLPPGVDAENTEEYFRNGILQIILPKKEGRKT
ncbi:MAG TPA: Hsp20/alpha crystallin family protein [Candidatus Brocadiales bacterium]|nr:Hsp20/alpha crystallin family protein [Candidatus Brocadiales bacterium]